MYVDVTMGEGGGGSYFLCMVDDECGRGRG